MTARVIGMMCAFVLISACEKNPVETSPLSPDAAASRGFEALNRGDDRVARAYFEIALEAEPDNAYALRGMDMVIDSAAPDLATAPSATEIEPPVTEPVFEEVPPIYEVEAVDLDPATTLTVQAVDTTGVIKPADRALGWQSVILPAARPAPIQPPMIDTGEILLTDP